MSALIVALCLMLAGRAVAQTFTTLYSFTAFDQNSGTNSDGATPESGLIVSGSILYGTTYSGGDWTGGTVFAVNLDGSGFTNLYSFLTTPPFLISDSSKSVR